MSLTQSDLDSFHHFASQVIVLRGPEVSMEDLVDEWQSRHDRTESINSIRRGAADAEAGRMRDLAEVDLEVREKLGFPPRR